MKQYLKKSFVWILIAVITFGINPFGVAKKVQAKNLALTLNDTFVNGSIDVQKEEDDYKIVLPSDGLVTITFQVHGLKKGWCDILNEDMSKTYTGTGWVDGTDTNPGQKQYTVALGKGTYIVKVSGRIQTGFTADYSYFNTGGYRLKGSFIATGNNEVEPNNYFDNGMTLAQDQLVTGFLWEDDSLDFYKITVPKAATVRLTYVSRAYKVTKVSLWNKDYTKVTERLGIVGSEDEPTTTVIDQLCAPGTYYIQVAQDYNTVNRNEGRYQLKWEMAPVPVSEITITGKASVVEGNSVQLTATVKPDDATNKTVNWKSSNTSIANVDKNGLVTAKKAGDVTITAEATDESGKSATFNLTVNEDTKKSTTVKKVGSVKVKAKGAKKVLVSWKKQTKASKYEIQISTNKNFKSDLVKKKVNSKSTKVTLKAKKKGGSYIRVRAIDNSGKYGKWSDVKSVKIK